MTINDIGELDRRITILSASIATDSYGQRVRTMGEYSQVWAKVDYAKGKESVDSDRLEAVKRVDFLIRYNSAISETMQISWDGDTFEMEAVLPVGRKEFMHLITRLVD